MIALPIKTIFNATQINQQDLCFEPSIEPRATAASPGSVEKLNVFRSRLECGEWLHHPQDETIAANYEIQLAMIACVQAAWRESVRTAKKHGTNTQYMQPLTPEQRKQRLKVRNERFIKTRVAAANARIAAKAKLG